MLYFLVYTKFNETVMVSGVAVRIYTPAYAIKSVVYLLSLVYIWLAVFSCVYIFLNL